MPKITILSGGTATNELVPLFTNLSQKNKTTYVLPISDNGGSTSEIIRVIGGPAIGDIRSRLTRLIPQHQLDLRELLSFRLSLNPKIAKQEWNDIVEGTHPLWNSLSSSTKEIFRAFFVHLHVELLKRSRITQSTKRQFRYELANVGNLFLTGARLFIGSLDSSIELFCRLTDVDPDVQVLPCINTNFTYHISALLENGLIITGQSQISHPSSSHGNTGSGNNCGDGPLKSGLVVGDGAGVGVDASYPPPIISTRPGTPTDDLSRTQYFNDLDIAINQVETSKLRVRLNLSTSPLSARGSIFSSDSEDDEDEESGNVPQYTHPELKKSQLHFNKLDDIEPLLSPIQRIFYISPYGEEICPAANPRVTSTITNSDTLIYSIGSLMTSIVPILVLKGVGKAIIGSTNCKNKILLLNGCLDRETAGMTAFDFVRVIVEAVEYSLRKQHGENISDTLKEMGVEAEAGRMQMGMGVGLPWNKVITDVIYMTNSNIFVDKQLLNNKGVKCTVVKRIEGTDYYDLNDLEKVLSGIISSQ